MKRILSVFLCLIMLLSISAVETVNAEAATKGYAINKLQEIQKTTGFIHGKTAVVTGNCYQFVSKVCEKLYGVKYDGEGLYENYKARHQTGNYKTVATMTTPATASLSASTCDQIKTFFMNYALPGDIIHYGSLNSSKSATHTVMVQSVDSEKLVIYQANWTRLDLPSDSCHIDTIYWKSLRENPTKSIYNSNGTLYSLNSLFYNKVKQGGTGIGITINRYTKYSNLYYETYCGTPVVTASRPSTTSIRLSWGAIGGASKYHIVYKKSTESDSAYKTLSGNCTSTTYDVTNLTVGATYNFKVRAYVNNAWQSYSDPVKKQVLPPTISSIKFNPVSTGLNIVWTKRSDIDGVRISRSTSSTGTYSTIATITNNSVGNYVDTGIKYNTVYYYKIQRYIKSGGTEYSTTSNAFSGKYSLATPTVSVSKDNSTGVTFTIKGDNYQDSFVYSVQKDGKSYLSSKETKNSTVTLSGLTLGSSYTLSAAEKTKFAEGSYAKASITVSPKAVESVVPTPVKNGIKVTYKTQSDVDGYFLYRSEKSNSDFKKVAEINNKSTSSYVDKTAKYATYYYYKIAAYAKDSSGNIYLGDMSDASAKVWNNLSRPSVSTSRSSSTAIRVKWDKLANASSYTVQYKMKGGSWQTISGVTGSSRKITGLTTGKVYYFRVKAVNELGEGGYCSSASKKVLPPTPSKLSIAKVSKGIKVSFTGNTSVTGYEIYRAYSKNGKYERIATVKNAKAKSYTDKKAYKGHRYYYKVRAYKKKSGATYYSPYSSKVNIKY